MPSGLANACGKARAEKTVVELAICRKFDGGPGADTLRQPAQTPIRNIQLSGTLRQDIQPVEAGTVTGRADHTADPVANPGGTQIFRPVRPERHAAPGQFGKCRGCIGFRAFKPARQHASGCPQCPLASGPSLIDGDSCAAIQQGFRTGQTGNAAACYGDPVTGF